MHATFHKRFTERHLICQIMASHFALVLLQLLLSCCRLELQSSVAFSGLQEVIHKLLGQRRTAVVQRISVVQRLQFALQLRECVCIHGLLLNFLLSPADSMKFFSQHQDRIFVLLDGLHAFRDWHKPEFDPVNNAGTFQNPHAFRQ